MRPSEIVQTLEFHSNKQNVSLRELKLRHITVHIAFILQYYAQTLRKNEGEFNRGIKS